MTQFGVLMLTVTFAQPPPGDLAPFPSVEEAESGYAFACEHLQWLRLETTEWEVRFRHPDKPGLYWEWLAAAKDRKACWDWLASLRMYDAGRAPWLNETHAGNIRQCLMNRLGDDYYLGKMPYPVPLEFFSMKR